MYIPAHIRDYEEESYRNQRINGIIAKLSAYEDSGLSPERVAELAKAQEEGRLVELPCKPGEKIYTIVKNCDECPEDADCENCLEPCEYLTEDRFIPYMAIIGMPIYFTRAEAEAALAEKQEGETDA